MPFYNCVYCPGEREFITFQQKLGSMLNRPAARTGELPRRLAVVKLDVPHLAGCLNSPHGSKG